MEIEVCHISCEGRWGRSEGAREMENGNFCKISGDCQSGHCCSGICSAFCLSTYIYIRLVYPSSSCNVVDTINVGFNITQPSNSTTACTIVGNNVNYNRVLYSKAQVVDITSAYLPGERTVSLSFSNSNTCENPYFESIIATGVCYQYLTDIGSAINTIQGIDIENI